MQAKALERGGRAPADGVSPSTEQRESVVLPRVGKPPLRFRGEQLCCNDSCLPFGVTLSIRLWRRDGGHLVAAATVVSDGAVAQDATLAGNIDEASDWVEAQCAVLAENREKSARKPRPSVEDQIRFLLAKYQQRALERAFLCLAGEALEAWDTLGESPVQVNGKGL